MARTYCQIEHTTEEDRLFLEVVEFVMEKTHNYMNLHDTIVQNSFKFVCHPTCRSLAKVLPKLRLVDGSYLGSVAVGSPFERKLAACRHSWLETPDGAIIDVCPVGITNGPILVIGKGPWEDFGRGQYVENWGTTALVSDRTLWRKTRVYTRMMREAIRLTDESEFVSFVQNR